VGDKISGADKEKAETQIKNLREAISQENYDQIKTLTTELQQTLYSIGTNLYQQTGATPDGEEGSAPPPPPGDGGTGGDDVIDAEYSES
jgi:hypothetical protein